MVWGAHKYCLSRGFAVSFGFPSHAPCGGANPAWCKPKGCLATNSGPAANPGGSRWERGQRVRPAREGLLHVCGRVTAWHSRSSWWGSSVADATAWCRVGLLSKARRSQPITSNMCCKQPEGYLSWQMGVFRAAGGPTREMTNCSWELQECDSLTLPSDRRSCFGAVSFWRTTASSDWCLCDLRMRRKKNSE